MAADNNGNGNNILPKFEDSNPDTEEEARITDENHHHHHHQRWPQNSSSYVAANFNNRNGGGGGIADYHIHNIPPPPPAPAVVVDQINAEDRAYFKHLPHGYRFRPTDQELIQWYLFKKVHNEELPRHLIQQVNIYDYSPDQITERYPRMEENLWYFFTPRDKKYFNGSRPNRAAGTGYWKATGADHPIFKDAAETIKIGTKRSLCYHEGKPKESRKTNWMMHEFMLLKPKSSSSSASPSPSPRNKDISGSSPDPLSMRLDDVILCKLYKNERALKDRQQRARVEDDGNEAPPKDDHLVRVVAAEGNTNGGHFPNNGLSHAAQENGSHQLLNLPPYHLQIPSNPPPLPPYIPNPIYLYPPIQPQPQPQPPFQSFGLPQHHQHHQYHQTTTTPHPGPFRQSYLLSSGMPMNFQTGTSNNNTQHLSEQSYDMCGSDQYASFSNGLENSSGEYFGREGGIYVMNNDDELAMLEAHMDVGIDFKDPVDDKDVESWASSPSTQDTSSSIQKRKRSPEDAVSSI